MKGSDLLSIKFSEAEKKGMILALSYHRHHDIVEQLVNTLWMPGETVLTVTEALILGGLMRPYYSFIADRILNHPAIMDGQAPTGENE